MIPEPSVEVIFKKLYVWLSTVALNGGNIMLGNPGSVESAIQKKKQTNTSKKYLS